MLVGANNLNQCPLLWYFKQFFYNFLSNHRVLLLFAAYTLNESDSTIGLCHVTSISDKGVVEVKAAILLNLNTLNAVNPLNQANARPALPV